ncbi:MAG: metalloregulator ArsR/SmtB family transcription factor [Candidatus Cloacimonetes bacterium]|nr:metalloregulator ArsR/SmtB family transcription factor [Candidatus Cloacimonadota bacterium]
MKEFVMEMAEIFKALGDANRLKIVKLLMSAEEKKLCVDDLAKILNISQPAVSQHIKILKNIKVLKPNKVGFYVYYYVDKKVMNSLSEKVGKLLFLAKTDCKDHKDEKIINKR